MPRGTTSTASRFKPYISVADPGGGGGPNRPRPPPPFFRPIFVFLAYFGRFSGAASRNLDSRPPLFTDPGSATAYMYVPGEIKIHDDSERSLASLAFYK